MVTPSCYISNRVKKKNLMKHLLLPTVIAALMSSEIHAESFTVSDIRVNGLQRVSAGSVFGALPLNVGESVDERRLADASRALFRTGFFQDIKLARDGNVLVIEVTERPSISSIEIEGNKVIATDDLLKGLKQSGLSDGEIFQQSTLDSVRNELQRQYVAQGRYSANIEAKVEKLARNRVAIKINISEGSIAKIKSLNVVGNTVFSDEEISSLFELKEAGWLSFMKTDDKYSKEKLTGDLERLRSYYMDRGYINMEVSSVQVSITPNKEDIYVTVNISEGKKYTVRDVRVTGDLKIPESEIYNLILVKPGQVFSRKIMTSSSDLITRRLGDDGYTFANVSARPEINQDGTVSLIFMIDPSKRAYVNRINFRGNTKTEDEVLRREMRQMEGGWASTYLINQSKTRLERLGYFKEVNVETPQTPGTDDQVDVNFTVEEQPSGSVTASVGFAQSAGLILGGSISQSNFLGTGNKVSLGLTRSEYQSRYNFSFVNPYWTEDGVSLGYNMFYRTTDYDKLNVDVSSYAVDSLGFGISLGYPISETARLNYGVSVQQDDVKEGTYTVQEISNFLAAEGKNYSNIKGSVGWSQSTLNKGVFATRGYSQSLVGEVTLPGSDLSFYKLDYNAQIFAPLSKDYVFRFHSRLGYSDSFGTTSRLPFYEHYYGGGFGSVRGFQDNSLGPRSTPNSANPDQSLQAFGGNVLVQGGTEFIFPMPFVKDQKSLRTVLFWDVGNVFETNCSAGQVQRKDQSCDISARNLASSVGVGLNWLTAIGPLSFSLGMPIKKPADSDTQIFQFSLGQTF